MPFETYDDVIKNGLWLEDRGNYSRYATDDEESEWVNHDREEIADPDVDEREEIDEVVAPSGTPVGIGGEL